MNKYTIKGKVNVLIPQKGAITTFGRCVKEMEMKPISYFAYTNWESAAIAQKETASNVCTKCVRSKVSFFPFEAGSAMYFDSKADAKLGFTN